MTHSHMIAGPVGLVPEQVQLLDSNPRSVITEMAKIKGLCNQEILSEEE